MYHFGLVIVLITTPLTSGLVYHCNFQDPSLTYAEHRNVQTLSFTQQLPASRNSSHYCVITTDKNDNLLQVKARTFGQSNGSLHVAIFDSRDSSIGHLDISANGPEETVTLCPQASGRRYFVLLTGTPNMHYTTEITDNVTEIFLNETKSFKASKTTLFKFKPTGDVTKKQLDITVLSPSDTVAYLKVSNICRQAMDTKYLDYSESSLRLTFDKQGRITLSRASPPSLLNTSGGFTYIGIALKKDTEKKSINLSLASSFDYSYGKPLCSLIFVSFFGGILVSLWALLCFRDPYILPQEDNPVDSDNLNSLTASNAHSHLNFYWIGRKLFLNVSNFRDCVVLTKIVSFILALSCVAIVLPVVCKRNFPNIFLFGCIFSSLLAICSKVIVEFWRSDLSHWTVRKLAFHFLKGSYVLVTLGIMATAVWIFSAKATTDKEKSPSESRDLNRNCAWLGFFDDHDLWHILSSFSLLMGSYLVLYISK
ncbi:PREDICTED: uncharacterized protein LOC107357363 [Acropora digitifera]|uniref:uncharacterized protein LOC107357363 n=1 Tax=Acropora digitifera TaxID=70779 RepID=UPI00077B0759|nr:PREDICTED: uncharacterized protein LOC107357363 [Acropora digitifera]